MFQSTHPHGVRLESKQPGHNVGIVSIHAPARGATACPTVLPYVPNMFQSTHPHGVRPIFRSRGFNVLLSFNPRTRTGCDTYGNTEARLLFVSIHAPARGATASVRTD